MVAARIKIRRWEAPPAHLAQVSFALLEAYERGTPVPLLAERLNLPDEWVRERIEAASLCLKLPRCYVGAAFA